MCSEIVQKSLHGQILSTQFNLLALQLLHLDNNQSTGTLSNRLSKYSQLLLLDVSNNYMSGEVPRWIHDMKNLSMPIMRNNSFHGQVPYELESILFSFLPFLNLFTGSLLSLSILQYVQHVHLQGNKINTKKLPQCLRFADHIRSWGQQPFWPCSKFNWSIFQFEGSLFTSLVGFQIACVN